MNFSVKDALPFIAMADVHVDVFDNANAPWNKFSAHDYWRRNYRELQGEDQEIIRRVSRFFTNAFADRPRARHGVDVGSGTNLYPALLMLPWTEQILLTDYSESNIRWLRQQLANKFPERTWLPFWRKMREAKGYDAVDRPCELLLKACASKAGFAGIERCSVFGLPTARWDVGTMFFVAESITEDPDEFRAAVARFVGALTPGAPFAAAFMAGSGGYPVAGTFFPAMSITEGDVMEHLIALGVCKPSVELLETKHRVRDGYAGMIVATGFARNH